MAKTKKVFWRIYGAYLVFIILVIFLGAIFYQYKTRNSEASKITDPLEITRIANEIASYELPPGYTQMFAREQSSFNTVVIGPEKDKTGVIIVLMQAKESSGSLPQIIEKGVNIGFFFNQLSFDALGDTTVYIKSKNEVFSLSEGRYEEEPLKKMAGFFDGKKGRAYLLLIGFEKQWQNFDFTSFINSIS